MLIAFLLGIANAMLINNVVLSQSIGICPYLGVSKKTSSAFGMGLAVIFVIFLAALVTWPIFTFILIPAKITFMDTIVYILVIASIVQFVEIVLKKFSPALYKSLGVYLPLITTNCAVLSVAQGNTDQGLTFIESMSNAIGTAAGFAIIIFAFSCIRVRLDANNAPKAFKGIPLALITTALMSLAFLGLAGLINL